MSNGIFSVTLRSICLLKLLKSTIASVVHAMFS